MSRDYAKKRRPRAATKVKPQSQVPGWVWLFTGSVLGAFVMFLIHLSDVSPETAPAPASATAPPAPTEDERQQPRFDFYKMLKETKVPVPSVEPKSRPSNASASSAPRETPASAPELYVLQVASFKGADDAEQLRAELILLNLNAHIETARVRNGETWHRVLVGPFDSRSQLAKARSILVSNQLEALVLKRAAKG